MELSIEKRRDVLRQTFVSRLVSATVVATLCRGGAIIRTFIFFVGLWLAQPLVAQQASVYAAPDLDTYFALANAAAVDSDAALALIRGEFPGATIATSDGPDAAAASGRADPSFWFAHILAEPDGSTRASRASIGVACNRQSADVFRALRAEAQNALPSRPVRMFGRESLGSADVPDGVAHVLVCAIADRVDGPLARWAPIQAAIERRFAQTTPDDLPMPMFIGREANYLRARGGPVLGDVSIEAVQIHLFQRRGGTAISIDFTAFHWRDRPFAHLSRTHPGSAS